MTNRPCPGNNTCCNRPEFDRTLFPCSERQQIERLVREVGRLKLDLAAVTLERDALREQVTRLERADY